MFRFTKGPDDTGSAGSIPGPDVPAGVLQDADPYSRPFRKDKWVILQDIVAARPSGNARPANAELQGWGSNDSHRGRGQHHHEDAPKAESAATLLGNRRGRNNELNPAGTMLLIGPEHSGNFAGFPFIKT